MARKKRFVYDNPGPHYLRSGYVVFESGKRYKIDGATVKQAAHYLAHTVKLAEHEGKHIPRGPHGLTPGAAAVLLHYGRPRVKHKRRAKPAKRRAVAKRRVVAKRRPVAKRTRAAVPRGRGPVDFVDLTAATYGTKRR